MPKKSTRDRKACADAWDARVETERLLALCASTEVRHRAIPGPHHRIRPHTGARLTRARSPCLSSLCVQDVMVVIELSRNPNPVIR